MVAGGAGVVRMGVGKRGALHAHQLVDDLRAQQRLPRRGRTHGRHERFRRRRFQQEPSRPGAQSLQDEGIGIEGREHDDRHCVDGQNLLHGCDTIHDRHANIHQHHIGLRVEHGSHRVSAVARLGHDLDIGRIG